MGDDDAALRLRHRRWRTQTGARATARAFLHPVSCEREGRCDQPFDAIYQRPQALRLNEAIRWFITGAVGVTFSIPSVVLIKENPKIVPTGTPDNGLLILVVYFLPALVLGIGTYLGLGATRALAHLEQIEHSHRTIVRPSIARGTVTGSCLPPEGRVLVEGILELSLEEALGVDTSQMRLQGQRVELADDARERLEALAACSQALKDPATGAEAPKLRRKRADRCDRNGWGFTDQLLTELAKPAELPAKPPEPGPPPKSPYQGVRCRAQN